MNREQLIDAIKRTSVLHGHFTLRSGRTSTYYVDKYRFATKPEILREVGILMAAQSMETNADRIAGAELGGVPLAASAGLAAEKPTLFIRNSKKDYGTSNQLEGELDEGDRVLLVEDVLTTGGQVLEAAKVLQDKGAVVTRIVTVIDRLEGARENIESAGFEMRSLVTTKDLGLTSADSGD
jgi:orotate phosphoribosyltransferase